MSKNKNKVKIRNIAVLVTIMGIAFILIFTQTSLAEKLSQAYKKSRIVASAYGYGMETSKARIITGSAYGRNHLLGFKLTGVDRNADRDTTLVNSYPFGDGFNGGVYVAAGDVTGDGIAEIGVASAKVGSHVLILNKNGIRRPIDYQPFASGGGVNIDMGDVDSDGKAELAFGSNSGIANLKVYRYDSEKTLITSLKPYGEIEARVKIALGDVDGDGAKEIITGAAPIRNGAYVAPHVRVFETNGEARAIHFYAFGPIEDIAAADLNGDGKDEIVVSSGSHLRAYRYNNAQTVLAGITAFPSEYGVAVRVAGQDVDQDGDDEIVTGTGDGGGPNVKVWETFDGDGGMRRAGLLSSFMAYDEDWRHGVDITGGIFH